MYKRILAGYDGSEASRKAVMRAAELASTLGAELHVITVVPPPSVVLGTLMTPEYLDTKPLIEAARRKLNDLSEEVKQGYNVSVKVDVLEGDPSETLIEYSDDNKCDLIVLGRRGLSGLERLLLGSVTQRVASKSRVDVLIVT
ncbi:MAG: universal stress protein [Desulfurococcales archaeon]|nr:universal stress protein [Desulfurococcales archaeon]